MSAGLAISAFMPSITSGTVFSTRRANSGAEAMAASNPFVGVMNFDIATGQIANAAKGVANIARESKNSIANGIISAEESIKALSKGDKVLNGLGKVVNFTAENINPFIVATGAVKVACSDDKVDAGARETLALGTMFASEYAAKNVLGMPINKKFNNKTMKVIKGGLYDLSTGKPELIAKEGKYKILNGKKLIIDRGALYKKSTFLEKQASAIKDYCATNKLFNKMSLKFVPGTLKGLGFVAASIGGYKLGAAAGDKLLGERTQVA